MLHSILPSSIHSRNTVFMYCVLGLGIDASLSLVDSVFMQLLVLLGRQTFNSEINDFPWSIKKEHYPDTSQRQWDRVYLRPAMMTIQGPPQCRLGLWERKQAPLNPTRKSRESQDEAEWMEKSLVVKEFLDYHLDRLNVLLIAGQDDKSHIKGAEVLTWVNRILVNFIWQRQESPRSELFKQRTQGELSKIFVKGESWVRIQHAAESPKQQA